jgi:hypothetical protein
MILRYICVVSALGLLALLPMGGAAADPPRAEAGEMAPIVEQLWCEASPETGTVFEDPIEVEPALDRAPDPGPPSVCPEGMVQASGEYCTEVKHECIEWLDDESLPYARCARYAKTSQCVGRRVAMSFCIDKHEYTRPGEQLPANYMSFDLGQKLCRSLGKRLCTDSEWNFACEGEDMRPYPYGWEREPKCNQDRNDLFEMKWVEGKFRQILKDHREASSDDSGCVSPFGVVNMAGNLDEPVLREATRFSPPFRNALKGGWWMAARNRCRPATTAHDDFYRDIQVGVRCCADLPGDSAATG